MTNKQAMNKIEHTLINVFSFAFACPLYLMFEPILKEPSFWGITFVIGVGALLALISTAGMSAYIYRTLGLTKPDDLEPDYSNHGYNYHQSLRPRQDNEQDA